MHAYPHLQRSRAGSGGFTLIELMIVVIVIGLLAAIALPSFNDSIRKSRRSDAFGAIAAVQQAQERWRSSQASYALGLSDSSEESTLANRLSLPSTTTSGYYTLALSSVTSTKYMVTATANTGKSQAQDGSCKVLAVESDGGNLRYGSGASTIDWADPNRCWAR